MTSPARYCAKGGSLVGTKQWLPREPFDYDWGRTNPHIGCNHIHCGSCGETVKAVPASEHERRYRCRCAEYVATKPTPLKLDANPDWVQLMEPTPDSWSCAGHPALKVPTTLDGVAISSDRLVDAARAGFASPPFVPPDTSGHAFWVSRLFWILPDSLRPALGEAVSQLLLVPDMRVAVRAMSFYSEQRMAAGGERLAAIARDHGARLATIPDPDHPAWTVEKELLTALKFRGFRRDDTGQLVDPEAHEVLREAVRAGKNPDKVVYTFGRLEPEWLAANAAEIVKNGGPKLMRDVVSLLKDQSPEARDKAFRAIADTDDATRAALHKSIDAEFDGAEKAGVLAALERRA